MGRFSAASPGVVRRRPPARVPNSPFFTIFRAVRVHQLYRKDIGAQAQAFFFSA